MKKTGSFLLFVIILLGLGGTGFFFGWAQLKVPPGAFGVMRSKTHGIDHRVIQDGEFRWIWYKLIPTNAVISVFSLNRPERSLRISNTLPSGDVYKNFASMDSDFSWEASGSFSFSLKPASLPSLVEKWGIANQEDLIKQENTLAGEIEYFLKRRLSSYGDGGTPKELESLLKKGSWDGIREEALAAFPDIEDLSINLQVVKYPDFALYNSARELYEAYIKKQHELMEPVVSDAAVRKTNLHIRLEELERYGELLTKYPILLQYLNIENGGRLGQ
jgi:hypothetical protein